MSVDDGAVRRSMERIDAAFPRVSAALVGLTVADASLVLGGMLAVCARADAEFISGGDPAATEAARAAIIDNAIEQGERYAEVLFDVKAWSELLRRTTIPECEL